MNIFPAQSEETKAECEEILSTEANFMSGQDSKPMLSIKQDGMTGGYKLTYGRVKIDKEIFNDCIMFDEWDMTYIDNKINHIKMVHKFTKLFDEELNHIQSKFMKPYLDKIKAFEEQLDKEKLKTKKAKIQKEIDIAKDELDSLLKNKNDEFTTEAEQNLLYTGHSLFSMLLPNDFEYFCKNDMSPDGKPVEITRGVLISGTLNNVAMGNSSGSLMHHIAKDYSNKRAIEFVSFYQMLINNWLVHSSFSIGIADCFPRDTDIIENELNKCLLEADSIIKSEPDRELNELKLVNVLNKAVTTGQTIAKNALLPTNNLVIMVKSGAKGKFFNITQVTGLVGQQTVGGARLPKTYGGRTLPIYQKNGYMKDCPDLLQKNVDNSLDDLLKLVESRGFVKNSYYRGLSAPEYFFHAAGGREGLIDTACKSVTYETLLNILVDGKCRQIQIGEWIDYLLENSKDVNLDNSDDLDRELLNLDFEVFIPTCDLDGNVSWGKITAVTRHNATKTMYKIKTYGGRDVTVTDSHSLLIWNQMKNQFERINPQLVKEGDYVPVTANLTEPNIINSYIDLATILPKDKFIYGSEYIKAKSMIEKVLKENNNRCPCGWWKEHNGKEFILPYNKIQLFLRSLNRSNVEIINENCIYPYGAAKSNAKIYEKLNLNEENGIIFGLYISEGNIDNRSVAFTNNDPIIIDFISKWFYKHEINYKIESNINKIGGTSTTIKGYSKLLSIIFSTFCGVGARNKFIHSEFFNAPKEFIKGLINGIISGDGYVTKNSIEIGSSSFTLVNDMNMCLSRFGIFANIKTREIKSNNLGTLNIADENRLTIRAQWATLFANHFNLISKCKQEKLDNIQPSDLHRNFKEHNDIVLDKIVEITKLEFDTKTKVYDLTVPSTLNFGLSNGLHVVDTATTGYIQRKITKMVEDLKFSYKNTIVNSKNTILDFSYGGDNLDAGKMIKNRLGYYSFIDIAHVADCLNKDAEWKQFTKDDEKEDNQNNKLKVINEESDDFVF